MFILKVGTKIKDFSLIPIIILVVMVFIPFVSNSQRHSIDRPPEKKIQIHIHLKTIFKKNPQNKVDRKTKKEERKKQRNEIKTEKKYWKHVDNSKEKGTNRKVVKRMKKNLKIANRHNHNKHNETKIKRLSRKKIKLPKISTTKIHWPWMKKPQE
ncbi:MAG: hypothetical protein A2X08_10555 [Bacteroidetes bacterium GWA2_32_17]|nr:MAG: hypothetical protein A2X08_10555 [Bacteroidetes bacterium GWA2_32_17]